MVNQVFDCDKVSNTVEVKLDKGCHLHIDQHIDQIHKACKKSIHDAMSFFGFDTSLPAATNEQHQEEDLAVYTWGADDYSNLGQAVQEGRDEFNDETFGSAGAVGRGVPVESIRLNRS